MANAFISEIVRMKPYIFFLLSLGACAPSIKPTTSESDMNVFMDQWHLAAHEADANAFFGQMSADGIYIGTDASERWLRDELRLWSKKAFEREHAWSFTALERNWQQQENFWICDELLETGMGICRATAVIVKEEGIWKIQHYQLSLAVPNEKIEDFKLLVNSP